MVVKNYLKQILIIMVVGLFLNEELEMQKLLDLKKLFLLLEDKLLLKV